MLHTSIPIIAILLLTTPGLLAQVQERKIASRAPDFVSVHETIGSLVVFGDSIPKKESDARPIKAGTVQDFVIETRTGLVKFVAVATADKCRAVPIDRIDWVKKHWALKLNKQELGKLRYLPFKDLAPSVPVNKVGASPGEYCYATKIARAKVIAQRKKPGGTAVDLILERNQRVAAFVKVRRDDKLLTIPIEALEIHAKGDVTAQPWLFVDLPIGRLVSAPRLEVNKNARLTNRAFRNGLYEYFDVPPPAFEKLILNP